jgi:hypothetical protein
MPDQPPPEFREVRQNATHTIHRTTEPGLQPTTVCDLTLRHLVRDPRQWSGRTPPTLRECETCFANVVEVDEEWQPQAGDLVHLSRAAAGGPREWEQDAVYVYVGPSSTSAVEFSMLLVPDGWPLDPHRTLPAIVDDARLREVNGLRGWNVLNTRLRPAADGAQDITEAQAMGRARLIATRSQSLGPAEHPVQECFVRTGHPGYSHTHTVGLNPLWGTPGRARAGRVRELHPDGTEVIFATGANLTTTTTERESTMPNIGDDILPGITPRVLRDLPDGTTLRLRSKPSGTVDGRAVTFGCKTTPFTALHRTGAKVTFTEEGVRVRVDAVVDDEAVSAFGHRINTTDLTEWCDSVTVQALAPVLNALVMEHGFYGCAEHEGEVIFVGNGHENGRGPLVPLVGKVYPESAGNRRLSGIVGLRAGLRDLHFRDCIPVFGTTTAHTMNLVQTRAWSLVPVTEAQVTTIRGANRRRDAVMAVTTSEVVVACSEAGTVPEPEPF